MKTSIRPWLCAFLVLGHFLGGCSNSAAVKDAVKEASSPLQSAPADSQTSQASDEQVTTEESVYAPNESILIQYSNLPGNQQDWITVVKASEPDDAYGEWFYTEGKKSGSHTFKGLPVGDYEVRVYHNWSKRNFIVQDRHAFSVTPQGRGAGPDGQGPQKTTYAENEDIVVKYANLPGNQQDWITIVKASDSDDTYGQWFYTKGKKSGSHTFKGLPVGDYEVRVYHNWPAGGFVVQQRYSLTVGD